MKNTHFSDVTEVSVLSKDQLQNKNKSLIEISISWPKLIERKVCVDRLNVTLNEDEEVLLFPDPADFEVSKEARQSVPLAIVK